MPELPGDPARVPPIPPRVPPDNKAVPPKGRIRNICALVLTRAYKIDSDLHRRIQEQFPRSLSFIDRALGLLFAIVSHNAFNVIAGLVGIVLAIAGVNKLVLISLASAWFISILWIARSTPMQHLTITSRFLVVICCGLLLGFTARSFGNWAIASYTAQQVKESSKVEKVASAAPPTLPATPPVASESEPPPKIKPTLTVSPEKVTFHMPFDNETYTFRISNTGDRDIYAASATFRFEDSSLIKYNFVLNMLLASDPPRAALAMECRDSSDRPLMWIVLNQLAGHESHELTIRRKSPDYNIVLSAQPGLFTYEPQPFTMSDTQVRIWAKLRDSLRCSGGVMPIPGGKVDKQ
jgi:hypothetical protein